MKRNTMRSKIAIIMMALITAFSLTACNQKEPYEETPAIRKVKTCVVDGKAHTETITVSGNVIPTDIVKLSYKLAGVIADIPPNEGDMVTKGQRISSLDSSDYKMQVDAAKADQSIAAAGINASQAHIEAAEEEYLAAKLQVDIEIPSKTNQAKSQLDLTQSTYDRIATLHEAGAVPTSQLDEIAAKLEVDQETYQQALDAKEVADAKLRATEKKLDALRAQMGVADAQSQKAGVGIDLANSKISDTTIYSPINGVILKKIMAAGETTSPGYPVVAIGKIDQVWVEIGVADQYINQLKKGQKATVTVFGIDEVLEGSIDEIGAVADTKNRTFPVKIRLNNEDGKLKPGMIGKVEIALGNSVITLIPLSSVIHLTEGEFIYIYHAESGTVKRRNIQTGVIVGDQIQVLDGLEEGEEIVIEGQFVLRENDQVTVYEEEPND